MSLSDINISIISIPVFYVLAFAPHSYATSLATGGNQRNFDNRNPRSDLHKEGIKKKLDAVTFARYERAEAASANAYENIPIFVAAVLAGNMAGLPKETMTKYALGFLTARVAHTLLYITITARNWAYLRSASWAASLAMSFAILYQSAVKLT